MQKEVIKTFVPADVYTDRQETLEYLHKAALAAAGRRTMSIVLLGQRRMGKTEIFKRLVNRLFFEQNPRDPKAVVPVYYSFEDSVHDETRFAIGYLENFMRYYFGFYTSQPEFVIDELDGEHLLEKVKQSRSCFPFTSRTFDLILLKYDSILTGNATYPIKTALSTPRLIADIDETTTVVFLDEFQNTRLPQHNFDIVGWFHETVESPNCPHFVTGSAMSILAREIIGRGSLFGRFRSEPIQPLTEYWGTELVLKAAQYYHAAVPEVMAPIISERCGGNPFYITAVIQQAAEKNQPISDEEILNKILAVDISSGFIWGELYDQVSRWIERLNDYKITKWILYLSALEEEDRIDLERIQRELKRREGQDVSLDTIRDVLVRLSRGDLLEYLELGRWFRKVKDPILLEFLKVWGKIEVEGRPPGEAEEELRSRYDALQRRIHEYKGYLAEVFMAQILLNGQNTTLPGNVFHSEEDVAIPWRFSYIKHRTRLSSGKGREIDLLGAAGGELWVCQSKWIERDPVGVSVLEELVAQAEAVKANQTCHLMRMWLFAYNGLTRDAKAYAQEHGIFWSSLPEFNELLQSLGLRALPTL